LYLPEESAGTLPSPHFFWDWPSSLIGFSTCWYTVGTCLSPTTPTKSACTVQLSELEFWFEAAVLASGIWLYSRSASTSNSAGKYGFPLFRVGLLALQWKPFVVGSPLSLKMIAVTCWF
jgi:hypothetical protein